MIPLLINVEVTGKGAKKKKKTELSINAGDIFVHGKDFDEILSKVSLLASPPSRENTFPINVKEPGTLR